MNKTLSRKDKEAIKEKWNDFPAPNQKPTECPYCEKVYIKPCDKSRYKGCLNWIHLKTTKSIREKEPPRPAKSGRARRNKA